MSRLQSARGKFGTVEMPAMIDLDELTPEPLAPVLSSIYDLHDPVACAWLSSGLNAVFRVTAGSDKYVLKIYRAGWRSRAEVLQEFAAVSHLHGKGVRVPVPIALKGGARVWSLTVKGRERQAALFTYAGGELVSSPDVASGRLLGRALAEIHNATDGFWDAPVRYDLEQLLTEPAREIALFLQNRPGDRRRVEALAAQLRARIRKIVPAPDWGYCHGDFRPANVHLDEAANSVITIDFELGGIGLRLYDLAEMQLNLHPLALEHLWGAPANENYEQGWAGFLDGYAEHRPLSDADRRAIPLFVACRLIHLMGFLLTTARQPGNEDYWRPAEPGGMPGGALFEGALRFLREWQSSYLRDL